MIPYPKIETLYNRGENFNVDESKLRKPEFGLIKEWIVTSKIDGTNLRLMFSRIDDVVSFTLGGRTDKALFSQFHRDVFEAIGNKLVPLVYSVMEEYNLDRYTLYGEGYGTGIQSGGYYRSDVGFILFDVLANMRWLDEGEIIDAAERLGLDHVPVLSNPYRLDQTFLWTLEEIADFVESGQNKVINIPTDREAEGIVARPAYPVFDRRGDRVMFKLKGSDFNKGKART